MSQLVELRSDTFSLPSAAMYDALQTAPLGDDVYDEDPTVDRLQRLAAALTGKEAALLLTSGTQSNLVGLLSQTRPGEEVIVGRHSDLYNYETSGMCAIGGLLPRIVDDRSGIPVVEEVRALVRTGDVHHGDTAVLALENAHASAGGRALHPDKLQPLVDAAHERGMRVHLDGARLFNAAVALGSDAAEIARGADSVSFSLSKGLSCPAGSLLCGSEALIFRARTFRKMLGGGMRQAGWLAIAGLVALKARDRLQDDHDNAQALAAALAAVPGIEIDPQAAQTNIVYFGVAEELGITTEELVARLWSAGVRVWQHGPRIRAVTHRNVTRDNVLFAADVVARACDGEIPNPPGPLEPSPLS